VTLRLTHFRVRGQHSGLTDITVGVRGLHVGNTVMSISVTVTG